MEMYVMPMKSSAHAMMLEKQFIEDNPNCTYAWKFSAEQYIKNHKMKKVGTYQFGGSIYEERHLTEEQWKDIFKYDKAEVLCHEEYTVALANLPLGDIDYPDCYLEVIDKTYTYEEYLELDKDKKGEE